MEGVSEELLAFVVVVGAVAVGYGKFIGPYQTEWTESIVQALGVQSRYKKLVNLAVGIVMGVGLTTVAAFYLDRMNLIPLGILAGMFASNEAAKAHDQQAVKETIADEVVEQVTVTDARESPGLGIRRSFPDRPART